MELPDPGFKYEEKTSKIIKVFYEVYNELGYGFLESVYQQAMIIALRQAGLRVDPQLPIPVYFRGQLVGDFYADLVVDELIIVELKTARALEESFQSQLLNYLRATDMEVGLLLNFGPKPQLKRLIFDNDRKARR